MRKCSSTIWDHLKDQVSRVARRWPLALPRPGAARLWQGGLEQLEPRVLLNGEAPENVFLSIEDQLDDPTGAVQVPLSVSAGDFSSNRLGTVGVGLHVMADTGSGLDPAAVEIRDGSGTLVPLRYADPDLQAGESLALVELPFDQSYDLSVTGERGTSGAFTLRLFLIGDADGDGHVDRAVDTPIVQGGFGSRTGDEKYRVEADANLDGLISAFDVTQHIRNIEAKAPVGPDLLPPVLEPVEDVTVDEEAPFSLTVTASDPDTPTEDLRFSLDPSGSVGATIDPITGAFSWTPAEIQGPGVYPITVRVTDPDGLSDTGTFTITVDEVNRPPALALIEDQTVDEGQLFGLTVVASDPDLPANDLTYDLMSGAPAGVSIDPATGLLTWTSTEADGPGTFDITVVVADNGTPNLTDQQTFTITVNEVNRSPQLDPIPDQTLDVGQMLDLSATANDPDLPPNVLAFGLAPGAPDGLDIDLSIGQLTWTPTLDQVGDHPVTVQVTDPDGLFDEHSLTITVLAVGQPPDIGPIEDQQIDEGQTLSIPVVVTDPDTPNDQLTIRFVGDPPAGVQFDPSTGLITWTPTEAQGPGDFSVTLEVEDSDGLTDSEAFNISVREVNEPPVLDPIEDTSVDEGQLFEITAIASDPDLPVNNLTFGLADTSPAGVSIDSVTGLLTWTPTEADGPGSFEITVVVGDNAIPSLEAQETFTVTVNEINQPPELDPIADQTVNVGQLLSIVVTASDPDVPANTLSFSLAPGAPPGIEIDANSRLLTWTPTVEQAADHSITVRVTDNGTPALSDTQTFTITVTDNAQPVVVASLANDTSPNPVACLFDHDLTGWSAQTHGGSTDGAGGVTPINCHAVLHEGDSFLVTLEQKFLIPDEPTALTFTYADLSFDTTDDFVRDAFEVALVDGQGNSLVHPTEPGRDVYFNVTEGQPPAVGINTSVVGQTVTLEISSIPAGTQATLIFRLVNNDSDTLTAVRLTSITGRGPPVEDIDGLPVAAIDPSPSIADTSLGDGVTSDPTIVGTVTDEDDPVVSLRAGFDTTPLASFVEVLDRADYQPETGQFTLNRDDLDRIFGGPLLDGPHTLHLIAQDDRGVSSELADITFTLDTLAPTATPGEVDQGGQTIDIGFDGPMADSAFDVASYRLERTDGPKAGRLILLDHVEAIDPATARVHVAETLLGGSYRLVVVEGVSDPAGNPLDAELSFEFFIDPPVTVAEVSPFNGEEMVALAREVVVRFEGAIDPDTVTQDAFYLIANSVRVEGSIRVSNTAQFATFFHDDPLPASTEVRVMVDGDLILTAEGDRVDADGDGIPGGVRVADFRTVPMARIPGTNVSGRVTASEPDLDGNDVPLEGVTIRVDGIPELFAVTDADGRFTLVDTPAPDFFVHIDGSTTTHEGGQPVRDTGFYPVVGKVFHSLPGQSVQMEMNGQPFDLHLPFILDEAIHTLELIDDGLGNLRNEEITVGLPDSQTDPDGDDVPNDDLDLVRLTVPEGSLINPDGSPGTRVGIFQVASDRLPAPLPDGLNHSFDITVQADAPNFDIPAPISFPNTEGLAPGEQSLLMSFDHARGEWIVVGTMTAVDEDGDGVADIVKTEEGVGVRAPGWHGVQQGAVARGGLVLGTQGGLLGRTGIGELAFQTGLHYWAIQDLGPKDNPVDDENGFVIRGVSTVTDRLIDQLVLAPNRRYRLSVFGVLTLQQGEVEFTTPGNGSSLTLPTVQLERAFLPDTDGDGLNDDAESIVGTFETDEDSDNDGIKDLAELRQGLDPLDGIAFPTGIIAGLPLEGDAREIVLAGSTLNPELLTAYVATGSHGLAIADVSRFNFPIVLGQIQLPGTATDVAVDVDRGIAVVTAGADGLHLVNIADPMMPQLTQTLTVSGVNQVELSDGLAFVGVGNRLQSYDLLTGELIDDVLLGGGTITGLAQEGSFLYTMDSTQALRVIDLTQSTAQPRGSLSLTDGAGTLFVGNGIAYAAAINSNRQGGFATAELSNPDAPIPIGEASVPGGVFAPGRDVAVNGSGLALVAGLAGFNGTTPALDILDISDPENTNEFLHRVPLPASPHAVSIANGIGFVADGDSDLQIVSYISFDTQPVPAPIVTIEPAFEDARSEVDGLQAQEGTTIAVYVDVAYQTEDLVNLNLQTRNVELLVNDVVVANAASFPFDFAINVPNITPRTEDLVIRARVTDMRGNVTTSNPLMVEVVPDTQAPVIVDQTPLDGAVRGKNFHVVRLRFSEPMDIATLSENHIRLVSASDPVTPIAPIDFEVARRDSFVLITYPTLMPDDYELVLDGESLTDRAGNPLGGDEIRSSFTIVDSDAVWIGGGGSNTWDNRSNWESGQLPGEDDDVFIGAPGVGQVVHQSGTTRIHSLSGTNPFMLSGGVLDIADFVQIDGGFTLAGGTLKDGTVLPGDEGQVVVVTSNSTLDGVTLESDVWINNGLILTSRNGLTLNGSTVTVAPTGGNALLEFSGTQTLDGTGEVVFGGTGGHGFVRPRDNGELTIGSGITIRTQGSHNATVGVPTLGLVNQGRIVSETPGRSITVEGTSWSNEGILEAAGGTLNPVGSWSNSGTLAVSSGTVNLGGVFTITDLGDFDRTGGTVNLTGTLTNTGSTLALNASTGTWNLAGGQITGGTVVGVDGSHLNVTSNSTLDGVTLESDVWINNGLILTSRNGLTLNGSTVTVAPTGGNALLEFSGTQTLDGTGEVVFGGTGGHGFVRPRDNGELTIGSGITIRTQGSHNATVGVPTLGLVNQGRIVSETPGRSITVEGTSWSNEGILEAAGGTLNPVGSWSNSGTLAVSSGTVNLGGVFTITDLGDFDRTGGTVNLTGTLTNTGSTLALNASTGTWNLAGGQITGGTVVGVDGSHLNVTSNSTLDGVTLESDVWINNGLILTSRNGLTLNGSTVTVAPTGGNALLEFSGTQTLDGTGEVVFGGTGGHGFVRPRDNGELTIGSGITIRTQGSHNATVGVPTLGLVNQGRIVSETPGRSITVEGTSWSNEGILEAAGGTLNPVGSWSNSGTLAVSSGTVNLGGVFTITDLGDFDRTGGTVNLTGTLTNTGSTLALNASTGTWNLAGGQITGGTVVGVDGSHLNVTSNSTLDGVTLESDVWINNGLILTSRNGLTLNGSTVTVAPTGGNALLEFSGTQTLDGTGEVVFGGTGGHGFVRPRDNGELTIGSGITIRTQGSHNATVGHPSFGLVNQGQIVSEVPGRSIGIDAESFTNEGTLAATDDGLLTVSNLVANTGQIQAMGGTLTLNGGWTLAGVLELMDSTVNLGGSFTISDLSGFDRTGGTVNLTGTLNNTGSILALNASTGTWNLAGGQITGGTVVGVDGSHLNVTSNSTLNGVTLESDVWINNGLILTSRNGLTLNGSTVTVAPTGGNALLEFSGTQTLDGTGEVVFGGTGGHGFVRPRDNGELTIGSGITIRTQGSHNATVGVPTLGLVNQGRIVSETPGRSITIQADNFTNEGTLAATDGGVLDVVPGPLNSGTVAANMGSTVRFNSNFTQDLVGAVEVEIGGISGDQIGNIQVSGLATLSGLLRANFVNGFVPSVGQTIDLLTFTSRIGAFTSEIGLDLGNGVILDLLHDAQRIAAVQDRPLEVGQTSPADGSILADFPTVYRVETTLAIDPDSVDANDLLVNGMPAARVTVLDLGRFDFDIGDLDLGNGVYIVTIADGAFVSLSGQPLLGITHTFEEVDSTVMWTNPAGGFWEDSANWSTGQLPRPADDVIIGVAGGVTITHRQTGTTRINSLRTANAFTLSGGILEVDKTIEIDVEGRFQIDGGLLRGGTVIGLERLEITTHDENRFDGVTLSGGDLALTNTRADLRIVNGLTLDNATVTLGDEAFLTVENTQTWSGVGEVVFNGEGGGTRVLFRGSSELTVEDGIVLRGGNVTIGGTRFDSGSPKLMNAGRIAADLSGQTFHISTAEFMNEGTLAATDGGTMQVNVSWVTGGTLEASGGGVHRHIVTLTNTDDVLDLTGFTTGGVFRLDGGMITGGTIAGMENFRVTTSDGNRLNGVTLTEDLALTNTRADLRIVNGLTLDNATVTLGDEAFLTVENTQTWSGVGEVVFNGEGGGTRVLFRGSSELTVEDGIVLRGGNVTIGGTRFDSGSPKLMNAGRIAADLSGQTFHISTAEFMNEGTLAATDGGTMQVNVSWVTGGTLEASGGGVHRHIVTLTNTDDVLDLTGFTTGGVFRLDGGMITGGTIAGMENFRVTTSDGNRFKRCDADRGPGPDEHEGGLTDHQRSNTRQRDGDVGRRGLSDGREHTDVVRCG